MQNRRDFPERVLSFSVIGERLKRSLVRMFLGGKMFKEKSGQKPQWCIVQADDSVDIPFRTIIVPGAEVFLF